MLDTCIWVYSMILIIIGVIYGLLLSLVLTAREQAAFGLMELSHPDNSIPVNRFVTPLHIVPEWYFLAYCAVL
ncbi:putative apocytochrome b [Toxoplasma gondii GAB2-2007-GAL-DOM2]|uniref:Cytochrome b n=1 Tax=Toxoplasma gondii GAB2-2007-GAL-DOM2 TaxID=1130820 RepID=A0A086JR93_TOXGO|nr:putative apocytochrome b [Toxoplasma gondii GAB2-2007-GAL-DOM2]